ncbi:DNA replication protein DnaC [Microbacterium aurum]|nr:DNA replication protein DnaC [Microbacterium aurum]
MDEAVDAANRGQRSYQGFLAELLLAECDDRDRRSTIRRVNGAGFPRQKWLGNFDFDANPNVSAATIHTLAQGDWIRRGDPSASSGTPAPGRAIC